MVRRPRPSFFYLISTTLYSTLCSAEITFKTDPKNTDYQAEHGASRNFEPWREERAVEEEDRLAKLEEEENNPMKALENRTTDSKREMDILDALQDIRARNARNERLGKTSDILEIVGDDEVHTEVDEERKREDEEDEELVRKFFSKVGPPPSQTAEMTSIENEGSALLTGTSVTVKRKADDIEKELGSVLPESTRIMVSAPASIAQVSKKKKLAAPKALGIKLVKAGKGR